MSSTYRILCLSHDPAIEAGEFTTSEAAEVAVREGLTDHAGCDLLIGRYSYPLVMVGCPSTAQHKGHRNTKWVDSGWLRVLAHARHADALPESVARHGDLSCWTEQRIWRLRAELGLDLADQVDESTAPSPDVVHQEPTGQVTPLTEVGVMALEQVVDTASELFVASPPGMAREAGRRILALLQRTTPPEPTPVRYEDGIKPADQFLREHTGRD